MTKKNHPRPSLSSWLGKGDGTFTFSGSQYTSSPYAILSADLNKDGWPDIIVANIYHDNVSILLGTSTGNLSLIAQYPVGDQPADIETGDFNEDSYPDLAVTNQSSNQVSILLNDRVGGFQATVQYPVSKFPERMITADLNEDKHVDLVVACTNNDAAFTLLFGDGKGGFTVTHPDNHPGTVGLDVAVGDYTCDGHPDIALIGGLEILKNENNTFNTQSSYSGSLSPAPTYLISEDFDKDGRMDFATASTPLGTVSIIRNVTACNLQPDPAPQPEPSPQPEPMPEPVLFIPNVFTPNGDSHNEFFFIKGLDVSSANQLDVYNRWGTLVYSTSNYQNDWNGEQHPSGVYYYSLRLGQSNRAIKGRVSILR